MEFPLAPLTVGDEVLGPDKLAEMETLNLVILLLILPIIQRVFTFHR